MSISLDAPDFAKQSGVVDSRNIASMDIQYKVWDAPNLQSGGGTAGAADDRISMLV